jgi:molybdopterin-containing oxidoreductase family iron-sulfur binding subunit
MRYGLVIDTERCIGCNACTMACKAENGTPAGIWWSKVLVREVGKFPHTSLAYTPVLCMHCENAPCVEVCPTGASHKRADGIVVVDYDKCMGCRYCETACPYDARVFMEAVRSYYDKGLTPYEQVLFPKHQAGVVEKCNFCADRVAQGKEPACVATCPAYARIFGDLDNPSSEASQLIARRHAEQLLPELGTNPAVYYIKA